MLESLRNAYEAYRAENPFFGTPPSLYSPMQYIMDLGGKRARPLLTLASGLSAGASVEVLLPLAHTMEVFHNFTLVHDDIMDNADKRRGQPTVHAHWDVPTAILAGDNMLVAAFEALQEYSGPNSKEIMGAFTRTAREVCEGQQMDMDFASRDDISEAEYLEMIRLKTAVLLGCCAFCGAMAGHATGQHADTYYNFAMNLGIAFQLDDDWLDTFGDEIKTGKKTGGDIAEGKKTWLYIAAKNKGLKIQGIYSIPDTAERIDHATKLYKEYGLDNALKQLSGQYADAAAEQLQQLAALGNKTTYLTELVEFLGKRDK